MVLNEKSAAVNRSLLELDLRKETGATIIAVIRGDKAINNPGGEFRLEPNDILVLWGAHQQLADAMKKL